MKGIQGLLIAIALGIAGAFFNWKYLDNKSGKAEMVEFVGIKPDRDIQLGQMLREADIVPVPIPKGAVGNLNDFAVRWSARSAALNEPVTTNIPRGSLLLRDYQDTPPQELNLAANERAVWVPVDTRAFVASLVEPGDLVTFLISTGRSGIPTPAPPMDPGDPEEFIQRNVPSGGGLEQIGPFEVLALGNRLGSTDVLRGVKKPQTQENVMAIRATVDQQDNLSTDVLKLMRLVSETNFRPVGVVLHPRKTTP
jgi:hypothetical protein